MLTYVTKLLAANWEDKGLQGTHVTTLNWKSLHGHVSIFNALTPAPTPSPAHFTLPLRLRGLRCQSAFDFEEALSLALLGFCCSTSCLFSAHNEGIQLPNKELRLRLRCEELSSWLGAERTYFEL